MTYASQIILDKLRWCCLTRRELGHTMKRQLQVEGKVNLDLAVMWTFVTSLHLTLRWRSSLLLLQSVQRPWSFLSSRKWINSVVRVSGSFQVPTFHDSLYTGSGTWVDSRLLAVLVHIFVLLWTHWAHPLKISNEMPITSSSPFMWCSGSFGMFPVHSY